MILEETYTLSNGIEIPKLGLGTWLIDNDDAAQAVRDAATHRVPPHRHCTGLRQRSRCR